MLGATVVLHTNHRPMAMAIHTHPSVGGCSHEKLAEHDSTHHVKSQLRRHCLRVTFSFYFLGAYRPNKES